MDSCQENESKAAGTRRGTELVRSERSRERCRLIDSVQDERRGLEKRETRPPNQSKGKAGSREVGVDGRTTLQTKVAVEGAVSVWIYKEDLKAKKNE